MSGCEWGSQRVGLLIWGKARFHICRGFRDSDVPTAAHFLFDWLKNWFKFIGAAEIRKANGLTPGQRDGGVMVKLCDPFRRRVAISGDFAMTSKASKEPNVRFLFKYA